jgi:hypothetical protein
MDVLEVASKLEEDRGLEMQRVDERLENESNHPETVSVFSDDDDDVYVMFILPDPGQNPVLADDSVGETLVEGRLDDLEKAYENLASRGEIEISYRGDLEVQLNLSKTVQNGYSVQDALDDLQTVIDKRNYLRPSN